MIQSQVNHQYLPDDDPYLVSASPDLRLPSLRDWRSSPCTTVSYVGVIVLALHLVIAAAAALTLLKQKEKQESRRLAGEGSREAVVGEEQPLRQTSGIIF